jgi:hypothetical protein
METVCLLPLKAEIHAILAQKIMKQLERKFQSCTIFHLGQLKTTVNFAFVYPLYRNNSRQMLDAT